MRILIDIGHPAHVHIFKNLVRIMKDKGYQFLFTCRSQKVEMDLLENLGHDYISFGKKYKSTFGKLFGLIVFNLKMIRTSFKFKPDIYLSAGSMYAAQVSFLFRKPHFLLEDTGNMEQIRLYLPFTDVVFSPNEIPEQLGPKQFRYHGYHELCYLRPKYFKPDPSIYDYLNIDPSVNYAVLRFSAWEASHDKGQGGFSDVHKDEIVKYLSNGYQLFISAEGEVPEEYAKYLFKIPAERIHDAMYYANLVVSEGATMASEAGVLGTPSIYVNSLIRCYNVDQEKYGLVYNFQSGEGVLDKIKEIEKTPNLKAEFRNRRDKMLSEKIDLTAFLVWFIEDYPSSKTTIFDSPDYQNKFKIS